jgi:hypothetical protein
VAKKEGKWNSLESKKESLEFSSYQCCSGFRIELRVGIEESSGKRLSGGCDSVVRVSCRESGETQLYLAVKLIHPIVNPIPVYSHLTRDNNK